MSEATTTEATGFDALKGLGTQPEETVVREPKIDAQGRSYATGKRKNAVARVWVKPGKGKITINGRDQEIYLARPVLRMMIAQPLQVTDRAAGPGRGAAPRAAARQVRPRLCDRPPQGCRRSRLAEAGLGPDRGQRP